MKQAKQKFKQILPSHIPKNHDKDLQPLSTAPLRFAGGFLDALPIPGAGAAARPILALVEGINKSRYDAEVIADLDRHLHSLARVLEEEEEYLCIYTALGCRRAPRTVLY